MRKRKLSENKFYVYIYLATRKPGKYRYGECQFDYEPFYVGKGYGRRYKRHIDEARRYLKNSIKKCNKYKINKINKIIKETGKEPIIIRVKNNLIEEESFIIEKELVKLIGYKECGTLTNLVDGGKGGVLDEDKSNKQTIELCEWIKKNNKTPTVCSLDKEEKRIARIFIYRKRLFNDECLNKSDKEIIESYGYIELLNYTNNEEISNKNCIELCEWIKLNNRVPKRTSKNKKEIRLNKVLRTNRRTFIGKRVLYDSTVKIIERYGCRNLFNMKNNEGMSNNKTIDICEWIKLNNKTPKAWSLNKKEKNLGMLLDYKIQCFKGNGKGVFYDSDQKIASSYGYNHLFEGRKMFNK